MAARRARISCGDMPSSEADAVVPDDVDDKPDCVLPVEAEGVWTIAPADGSTRNGGGNCVVRGVSGATDVGARAATGLESVRLATGEDPTDEDPTGEGAKEDGLAEYGAAVNVEAVAEVEGGEAAGAVMGERETAGFAAACPVIACQTSALPAAPVGNGRAELAVADRALPVLEARLEPRPRCIASLCSRIDARVGIVRPELMRAPVEILLVPLLGVRSPLRSLPEAPAEDARRSAK